MYSFDHTSLLFAIHLFLGLHTCVSGYFCTQLSINKCLSPFQEYSQRVEAVYPEDEVIEKTCAAFQVMKKCVEPMRPTCDVITRNTFDGILDSFEFVCTEKSIGIYKEHKHCLGSPVVQAGSVTCTESYHRGTWEAKFRSTVKSMYKEMCKQAKDYLNCIKSDVEEHCGKEAADWQHTVNAKAVKPVLRTIDCKLEEECSMQLRTIIGLGMSVILVLILLCLAFYKYITAAKRKRAGPEIVQQGTILSTDPRLCTPQPRGGNGVIIPAVGSMYAAMYSTGHLATPQTAPATAPAYEGYYDPPAYTAKEAEVGFEKPTSDNKY